MAKVIFLKDLEAYNTTFKKGDIKQVSTSVKDSLISKGIVEIFVESSKKTPKKSIKD